MSRHFHAFYARPITPEIMERMRAAGATDSSYFEDVEAKIKDGKAATILELCGAAYHLMSMFANGAATGRRHPLGDCAGAVRFEGLHGNDCKYAVLIGS